MVPAKPGKTSSKLKSFRHSRVIDESETNSSSADESSEAKTKKKKPNVQFVNTESDEDDTITKVKVEETLHTIRETVGGSDSDSSNTFSKSSDSESIKSFIRESVETITQYKNKGDIISDIRHSDFESDEDSGSAGFTPPPTCNGNAGFTPPLTSRVVPYDEETLPRFPDDYLPDDCSQSSESEGELKGHL